MWKIKEVHPINLSKLHIPKDGQTHTQMMDHTTVKQFTSLENKYIYIYIFIYQYKFGRRIEVEIKAFIVHLFIFYFTKLILNITFKYT